MSNKNLVIVLSYAIIIYYIGCFEDLNLPPEHVPYYFSRFPSSSKECANDNWCPHKNLTRIRKCWGYEDFCYHYEMDVIHECFADATSWKKTRQDQMEMFWTTADFGYIKKRLRELSPVCEAENELGSSLFCSRHMRYCKATNLYLDFRKAKLNFGSERFRENVFKSGEVGGKCNLDRVKLKTLGDQKSPLQSWFAELEKYSELPFHPVESSKKCDVFITKPTIFMKMDAGVNMFHHFCDFINLYASQHLNGSFDQDVQIIMWDTSPLMYGDFFESTWKVFTHHPIIHLNKFDGKRVCVREAMFALLPRMRYGLYYNMPLIPGCWKSNLFRAFSRHVTFRLKLPQLGPHRDKVRVTLLVRSTNHRKVLNQHELLKALLSHPKIEATLVDYNSDISFTDQLYVTHNSDVFIGMHGAGLTHLLFLPNWGAVFELYNCDDKDCYYDLARLRGVKYYTWENMNELVQEDEGHHPTMGAHKKFTNYSFGVKEFMRLVLEAVDYVEGHQEFVQARLDKYHNHDSPSPSSSSSSGLSEALGRSDL